MLIKCPNPQCGKRIPSYSTECPFCNAPISSKDKVPIENVLPQQEVYIPDEIPDSAKESKTVSIHYPELVPFELTGVIKGTIGLTPKQVMTKTHGPSMFSTHARIKIDPQKGSSTLYQGAYTLQVYRGGLIFPSRCPVTMDEPDHVEFFEVPVSKQGLGKVTFNAKPELKDSIIKALCYDRYWFAVPFSHNHGRFDKAIRFSIGTNTVKSKIKSEVTIKDRSYAQEFAQLNRLENGRWCGKKHVNFITYGFLMFVIGLTVLAANVMLIELEGAVFKPNVPLLVGLLVVSLSGLGAFFYGLNGEKL